MPIHDLSYQPWNGTRSTRSPAWIIARFQLRFLLRRRSVRLLLLVSILFTLAWGTQIYLESRAGSPGVLQSISDIVRVDAASFERFLTLQRLLHLLLCVAAADVIALDRRHRALQIYLARPVRRVEYVLGKGVALAILLSVVSWVPGLLLVLLKTLLQAGPGWLSEEPWLVASIGGYGIVLVVPCTALTLAVSSLTSSPRLAGAHLFAFLALQTAGAHVMSLLTRSEAWQFLSLNAVLDQLAAGLFGGTRPLPLPVWPAGLALVLLVAGSAFVLHRRIRPLEVVGGR